MIRGVTVALKSSAEMSSGSVISITVPPAKSMPRFKPRIESSAADATRAVSDTISARKRSFMKETLVFSGQRRRSMGPILPYIASRLGRNVRRYMTVNQRVTTKAVNTEVRIPMASVTAKPFTGPDPTM